MVDLIARYADIEPSWRPIRRRLPFPMLNWLRRSSHPVEIFFASARTVANARASFPAAGSKREPEKGAEIDEYLQFSPKARTQSSVRTRLCSSIPTITSNVDYEAELAVIIGKPGRNILQKDAYGHIFGYTIVNDLTARDRQKNHKQWFMGQTLDTFCPMGPWITTSDELDPENLDVKCWANGEYYEISAGLTLVPGDVIATGSPAGSRYRLHSPEIP